MSIRRQRLYRHVITTMNQQRNYSDGDIILAATAFINGACIITANINDFPRPYFNEASGSITMTSKKSKIIPTQTLKPDINYLNRMIKKLYPPKK